MNSTKVFGQYVIAFDGIGKFTREWEWYENCLKKHKHGQPEGVNQYYAYALESSIVLANGLTIPLMTEFLDRSEYDIDDNTTDEKRKQDSELKAFKRLAKGLKEAFPRLKIAVTLDGLYANGPLMEICKDYEWDFMIILKDGSLKSVWENIEGIKRKNAEEIYEDKVINRKQQNFWWINGIEYTYGNNNNKSIKINVVICEETWHELNKDTGLEVQMKRKFAWISCNRLTVRNVGKRCNYMGRPRWNIETQNLVEKHHVYSYEHCFSYNWNAMKEFHYLMHLGYIINVLTLHTTFFINKIKEKGVRGTIKLLWKIFSGIIPDIEKLKVLVNVRYQIRFAI